ncbi:ANK3 [Symbiodinium natans]|uniref:ANK3 protein n=1 Tax=Symbiodinium natans TaxID=878477 RepID=A0A812NME9_9DINO|nr:ANK3 [Symbiodinium natans]
MAPYLQEAKRSALPGFGFLLSVTVDVRCFHLPPFRPARSTTRPMTSSTPGPEFCPQSTLSRKGAVYMGDVPWLRTRRRPSSAPAAARREASTQSAESAASTTSRAASVAVPVPRGFSFGTSKRLPDCSGDTPGFSYIPPSTLRPRSASCRNGHRPEEAKLELRPDPHTYDPSRPSRAPAARFGSAQRSSSEPRTASALGPGAYVVTELERHVNAIRIDSGPTRFSAGCSEQPGPGAYDPMRPWVRGGGNRATFARAPREPKTQDHSNLSGERRAQIIRSFFRAGGTTAASMRSRGVRLPPRRLARSKCVRACGGPGPGAFELKDGGQSKTRQEVSSCEHSFEDFIGQAPHKPAQVHRGNAAAAGPSDVILVIGQAMALLAGQEPPSSERLKTCWNSPLAAAQFGSAPLRDDAGGGQGNVLCPYKAHPAWEASAGIEDSDLLCTSHPMWGKWIGSLKPADFTTAFGEVAAFGLPLAAITSRTPKVQPEHQCGNIQSLFQSLCVKNSACAMLSQVKGIERNSAELEGEEKAEQSCDGQTTLCADSRGKCLAGTVQSQGALSQLAAIEVEVQALQLRGVLSDGGRDTCGPRGDHIQNIGVEELSALPLDSEVHAAGTCPHSTLVIARLQPLTSWTPVQLFELGRAHLAFGGRSSQSKSPTSTLDGALLSRMFSPQLVA